MNRNSILYIILFGLAGLLTSCEKDEVKVIMLDNPVAPTLVTVPDLILKRADGNKTLEFTGTAVDPGFQASANYFLEGGRAGTNFANPFTIYSGTQALSMKITVSELNTILLRNLDADQASSVELRLRAVLVVDAGTGAPGTSASPFQYISPLKTVSVSPYGLPRLDLVGSGMDQKIESALGDGKYYGLVKLDKTKPFTLRNPDTNTIYGASGGALAANGAAITPADNGWHKLTVDTQALTYKIEAYMIGLVGSATPSGWDSPDQKMDYDAKTGTWRITINLVNGDIKFRLNDGWAWNLGGPLNALTVDGPNISVTAGNYTIVLTITNPGAVKGEVGGSCTITKN
jgi:starch-binding outer membrane protein SusE/F